MAARCHYTTTVQCVCGHRFAVCIHAPLPPTRSDTFVVVCPVNRSRIRLPGATLIPAAECPAGAVVVVPDATR